MQDKVVIGNSKIRSDRRFEVLRLIRKMGSISRTEIFEKTQISKPTVTRIIEDLLQEGLIKETGAANSSVGRPPVSIELNPKAHYCIGINISRNSIHAALVDFTMKVVNKKEADIKGVKDADKMKQIILEITENLIQESGCPKKKFLGVGIGIPGIVDYPNGIIIDFITHHIRNVQLRKYLEDKLETTVIIDNNANTRVLGEYWYGYGVNYKDILFVICSEGVGSGMISDGKILRPGYYIHDGLGHMVVDMAGRQCTCGKQGCVEAYSSTESIEEIAREYISKGRKTKLLEEIDGDLDRLAYGMLCKMADEHDKLSIDILVKAAEVLSSGLANFIQITKPELVILSGNLFDKSNLFYRHVEKRTREKLSTPNADKIVFKKRKVEDGLYEIGAATMIYRTFFNH